MPKTITSPVKRWSGTVTLFDPLTLAQAIMVEDAIQAVRDLRSNERTTLIRLHAALQPAILACVERWNLAGIADHPEFIPATPGTPSAQLITWIWTEIKTLFEDTEVPND